ncbi:MAG: glycosyltransferase family 39 protein [Oscillatoriales cyanobacterium C42_A2020_001]|nr:glycosyltransferase family 39 protein [Leptolyngbyaceae cyanobacterium C42_A2020_001]
MILDQKNSLIYLKRLSLLILGLGIFIRVAQYISNRSLWGDEVMLALNLMERSYPELLQPLTLDQAAPPGFLYVQKFAMQTLGNNEYALRLFPLITGIISMIAFYQLGKWAVSAIALPIALALFAFLKFPLYYATEVKQYSSDVMIALLLCLLLIPLRDQVLPRGRSLLLGFVGAIAVWFSHPAVFVLAGIEAANLITLPKQRRKPIIINRLPAYFLWIVSFATLYFLITANVMKNQSLQSAWGGEYPQTVFDLIWLLDSFGRVFYRPLGFSSPMDGVALITFIIGCVAFFKKDRIKLLILMSPVFVTLLATYLHKYPFRGRLILFLAPFFILVIAEGIAFLLIQLKQRKKVAIAGIVLAGLLLIPPLVRAGGFLIRPETKEEIRPVIEYVKTHQQPGDAIYVDAFNHFKYYAARYGYSPTDYIGGYQEFFNPKRNAYSKAAWQNLMRANNIQNGQRMWFVFVGVKQSEEAFVKARLDELGQQLDYYEQPGSSTYLYQLK